MIGVGGDVVRKTSTYRSRVGRGMGCCRRRLCLVAAKLGIVCVTGRMTVENKMIY